MTFIRGIIYRLSSLSQLPCLHIVLLYHAVKKRKRKIMCLDVNHSCAFKLMVPILMCKSKLSILFCFMEIVEKFIQYQSMEEKFGCSKNVYYIVSVKSQKILFAKSAVAYQSPFLASCMPGLFLSLQGYMSGCVQKQSLKESITLQQLTFLKKSMGQMYMVQKW